jgi:hypothetical protein
VISHFTRIENFARIRSTNDLDRGRAQDHRRPRASLYPSLTQLIVLSHTISFGPTTANGARISFTRLNNQLGTPQGGVGVSLGDQGFSTGSTGIQPGFPKYVGVETLYFNSFTIGTSPFSVVGEFSASVRDAR